MNQNRIRIIKKNPFVTGPIIYWMSRDQRVEDNWALVFSLELAKEYNQPCIVVFNLVKKFLDATRRHFHFMLNGLSQVQEKLRDYNIPFKILIGEPTENILKIVKKIRAGALVTDFDPLKIKRNWKQQIANQISIPFYEVDAHNIVPTFVASDKLEFAAYTFRPKIHKVLPYFLEEFTKIERQKYSIDIDTEPIEPENILPNLDIDHSIREIKHLVPGSDNAKAVLENFIQNKLHKYSELRNNPNYDYQSNLSAYIHFGQISAQRIALEIKKLNIEDDNTKSFLEELIVRRELSDNYCYYCLDYDNNNGFPEWARNSLNEHLKDEREFIYTTEQFEKAQTHEDLWNAAQNEMVRTGKMHGYMRMYWAKKILEWSPNPTEAQRIAIYLNDKYSIDGRDPNGYTGIAWSIGGVHDRPWVDRPVFGKIRYMNLSGAMRKFDVNQYINNNLMARLL